MKKTAILLPVLALMCLTAAAAERLGYITVRIVGQTYSYYSAQAIIDDDARTVKLGSGFNACVPQYLSGHLVVPGSFYINGSTYRLTALSPLCFRLCDKLTAITIGDGPESIGSYAFVGCNSLDQLTLPMTVKRFESGALAGCKDDSNIIIHATDPPEWMSDDVCLFTGYDVQYSSANHYFEVSPVAFLDYFDYEYGNRCPYWESGGWPALQYELPRLTLYSTSTPRLLDDELLLFVVSGVREVDGAMTAVLKPLDSQQVIPANTGVVIFNPNEMDYLVTDPYTPEEAPARYRAPEQATANLLQAGTDCGMVTATGSNYVLADNGSGDLEFTRLTADTMMPAHSAVLETGDTSLPATLPVLFDINGTVTGIETVRATTATTPGPAYDLQGRRLNRRPDHGIYIQDRQKRFVP